MKNSAARDRGLRLLVFSAVVGLWELFRSYSQNFLLAMPIAPFIPIVIIALGLGLSARVFIVVLFAFIFITVNTRAGVRNVEPSLIEMAKSFGASESQIWRRIVIPGATPAIFAGMR